MQISIYREKDYIRACKEENVDEENESRIRK